MEVRWETIVINLVIDWRSETPLRRNISHHPSPARALFNFIRLLALSIIFSVISSDSRHVHHTSVYFSQLFSSISLLSILHLSLFLSLCVFQYSVYDSDVWIAPVKKKKNTKKTPQC